MPCAYARTDSLMQEQANLIQEQAPEGKAQQH